MTSLKLEQAPYDNVHPLRRDPYRLFFPLGVVLSFFGVGQWLLFAAHVGPYRSIFHAMTQVEGFIGCFVCGFLFTFIPRRTGAAPPSFGQLFAAAVSPVGIAVCAWFEKWGASAGFYLVQMGVLLYFVLSRLLARRNKRPADDNLIWVPLALSTGLVGSVITGVAAAKGAMWLHDIGRHLVLEGVVAGLVIGVGSFLVPVVTQGAPPARTPSLLGKLVQVQLFAVFVISFFIEGQVSMRAGLLLRAAVAVASLVWGAKLWRPPTQRGFNRWLVWLGAWCLPAGFLLAGLFPVHRAALIHLVYIGGFGLLALSVGTHVVFSHANQPQRLSGAPLPLVGLAICLSLAVTMRFLLELDPSHYFDWMTGAALAFLAAATFWLIAAVRWLVPGAGLRAPENPAPPGPDAQAFRSDRGLPTA